MRDLPRYIFSNASNLQLYGQQDRYVLSLKSAQMVGGYSTVNKVHLPPSDYSYSDTGMFYDEASSKSSATGA